MYINIIYIKLYVNGKLAGGIDILQAMEEEGELKAIATESNTLLHERLASLINSAPGKLIVV